MNRLVLTHNHQMLWRHQKMHGTLHLHQILGWFGLLSGWVHPLQTGCNTFAFQGHLGWHMPC